MSTASTGSTSGRVWLAAMGLMLAAAGALFTWVLWTAWQRAEETRRWPSVPCRIVSSRIISERPSPNSNIEHRVEIRYSYEFEGKPMMGERIRRVDPVSGHEAVARQRLEEFPVGRETVCFVNPQNHGQAVLQHGSRAALYAIWFPLLFIIGGLGMLRGALVRAAPRSKSEIQFKL